MDNVQNCDSYIVLTTWHFSDITGWKRNLIIELKIRKVGGVYENFEIWGLFLHIYFV
jgi:hypothetical protein